MDEKKLLKYAVDYLSKYDSSKVNLVNVLKRKILRLKTTNYEKGKLINIIESIIIKLEKNKFIDDNRYSSTKILSLSNSGKSKNFIFNYLIKKGVNKSQIQNNLNLMKQDNETELVEPLSCSQSQGGCGATVGKRETRFSLIESKLKLINNQWIEIQELPENVPSGSQPGRGRVLVEGDLVNKHTPGERVTANMIPIIRSEYKRSKKTT